MRFLSVLLSTSAQSENLDLNFEPGKFIEYLSYMGKGMLVIFVIIGVIILSTLLINKIFSKKK